MSTIPQLTIATFNRGKMAEYFQLLDGIDLHLKGLPDFPNVTEVDESGATFAENARLKATGYALQTRSWTLADDSGLVVDVLGGRPGVLSARYGGDGQDFAGKMAMLLDEIRASGEADQRARFICEIALSDMHGTVRFEARGVCEGTIAAGPLGSGGFGYDPIFIPDGFQSTFGELSGAIKHEISHRARAFAQIIPYLRDNMAV